MQFSKSAILALLAGVVSLVAAQDSQATGTQESSPTGTESAAQASGSVLMHVISVSDMEGALTFSPNSVKAEVGDLVQFQFWPKNHSVVQSTFKDPCAPMPESDGVAPFFSGYLPVKMTDASMPVFTIQVNDTKPIWFYCSQAKHCQMGMVGVINPPADSPNTIEAYAAAAKKVETAYDPNTAPASGSSGSDSESSGSSTASSPSTLTTAAATGADSAASPSGTGNSTAALGSGSVPAFHSSSSLTVFLAAIVAAALLI